MSRPFDLLAVETSAETCSVALHSGGEVREWFEHTPMRHAEELLPAVRALLTEAGVRLSDLDAIAFGRGPGSFTSLRIGIGAVQGLAWGARLPVVPVSSLAAVAQQAVTDPGREADHVCVAMDARMQEVFCGEYIVGRNGLVEAAGTERVCAPGAVAPPATAFIAAGNGFERYEELGPVGAAALRCLPDVWPRAGAVAALAQAWLQDHEPLPAEQAQPVYIRDKVAIKPGH